MEKFRKWVTFTLIFALSAFSLQAQDDNSQYNESCCQAYEQSSQVAYWSAYITIGVFVAAAVVFGLADNTHTKTRYSSQDGLGSMGSYSNKYGSGRSSSRCSGSGRNSYSSGSSSHY